MLVYYDVGYFNSGFIKSYFNVGSILLATSVRWLWKRKWRTGKQLNSWGFLIPPSQMHEV